MKSDSKGKEKETNYFAFRGGSSTQLDQEIAICPNFTMNKNNSVQTRGVGSHFGMLFSLNTYCDTIIFGLGRFVFLHGWSRACMLVKGLGDSNSCPIGHPTLKRFASGEQQLPRRWLVYNCKTGGSKHCGEQGFGATFCETYVIESCVALRWFQCKHLVEQSVEFRRSLRRLCPANLLRWILALVSETWQRLFAWMTVPGQK